MPPINPHKLTIAEIANTRTSEYVQNKFGGEFREQGRSDVEVGYSIKNTRVII